LEVSLFWGAVNFILVGVVILAAAELPEWRKTFRIKRRLLCELVRGEQRIRGIVDDINEVGALIRVNKQLLNGDGDIFVSVKTHRGKRLTVRSRMCRHKQISACVVEIGLKFIDVDEKTVDSLIVAAFSDSHAWNYPEVEPGVFQSLWSLLRVFRKVVKTSRKSHRIDFRLPYQEKCLLVLPDRTLEGTVGQISATGLSVNIPGTVDLVGENGTLYVKSFAFQVRRRWAMQCEETVVAGFAIEQVNRGADQWRELTSLAA
jgi:hypothetical protein